MILTLKDQSRWLGKGYSGTVPSSWARPGEVAGPLPMGPGWAQPKWGTWVHLPVGLPLTGGVKELKKEFHKARIASGTRISQQLPLGCAMHGSHSCWGKNSDVGEVQPGHWERFSVSPKEILTQTVWEGKLVLCSYFTSVWNTLIRKADSRTGCKVDIFENMVERRTLNKLISIMHNRDHPHHQTQDRQWSTFSDGYSCCWSDQYRRAFLP